MMMLYQFIIYLNLALSPGIFGKSVKILGGENVHITEFPYMAALRYVADNQLFCGGTIVSRWNILTAAHCLIEDRENFDRIRIYTGVSCSTSTSGPTHEIHHANIHPGFTGRKEAEEMNRNDIAVITVKERIKFNRYQNKAHLPRGDLSHHDVGMLTGWGLTSYPDIVLPDQLQAVAMRVFSNDYCKTWLPFEIFEGQFCGYKNSEAGACLGDSGGPLVINNRIVGIMSFTCPCATGIPDIYTRIYFYLDFIRPLLDNS